MRQYPVAFDTVTFKPYNYSNQGTDLFGFGKVTYTPSDRDLFYVEGNGSGTNFQIPFDSANGVIADNQKDRNSFLNLRVAPSRRSRRRRDRTSRAGSSSPDVFYRRGSLTYTPGANDDPELHLLSGHHAVQPP